MAQTLYLSSLMEEFAWTNSDARTSLSTSTSSLEEIAVSKSRKNRNKKSHVPKGNTGKEKGKNYYAKLKTETCKMYELGFVCPYGDRCSFAHGASELKQKLPISAKYRTVCCTSFQNNSYCQYGSRCHFIHKTKSKEEFKPFKTEYQQVLDCLQNSCEPIGKAQRQFNLEHESFIEIFKLPKLSVFESIRE